jgi:sorting nexin-9/18/33
MSAHPVIGKSEVFVHFLQCDDASNKWKAGKRKAEKDEYRGAQWYCTLTVPGESVDTTVNIKERVDKFARATINLDNCIKNVSIALEKIAGFHTTTYKKEFTHFGKKLEEFGLSLSNDALDAPNNSALSTALVTAGNTYTQIGNLYGEQSKTDINLLLDRFGLYRGIAQQMPDIVAFEKQSIQLYEEFQQKPEKLEGRPFVEVAPRREIISHVTFAEINQFNKDKVDDFNNYMKQYLQQQIAFYTEITECLKRAYANFEKIPTQSTTTSTLPQQNQSFRR